jgi:hypothetical protein
MRATYEDLLRLARRAAVDVHQQTMTDPVALSAGWQAVLTATRHHVALLRGQLVTPDLTIDAPVTQDSSLRVLAVAIGAGGDLLAIHDARSTTTLTDREGFAAARAEIASIALMAANAVLRDAYPGKGRSEGFRRLRGHLAKVMTELEQFVQSDERRAGLGLLGGLAAGGSPMAANDHASLARAAVRWQQAHESASPTMLLTRDLRSMTAQMRTACGYAWHLADHLVSAGRRLGFDPSVDRHLKSLARTLGNFEANAARVARCWQRRLSDVNGHSTMPGELAFLDLSVVFNQLARPNDHLLRPQDLVPDERTAICLLDVLDELVHSAERVARVQQRAVARLIMTGRLYVPVAVLVQREPRSWPTGIGSRSKPKRWVSSTRPDCFSELTDAIEAAVGHLSEASTFARGLAGTTYQTRPCGEERVASPLPAVEPDHSRRREVAIGIEPPVVAQEFDGPLR